MSSLVLEFKRLCLEHQIVPVILYIPSKLEVYDDHITTTGQEFNRKLVKYYIYPSKKSEEIENIANNLQVKLINILPYFKRKAQEGKMLYYAFDTHWNTTGIELAAEFIVSSLALFSAPALENEL